MSAAITAETLPANAQSPTDEKPSLAGNLLSAFKEVSPAKALTGAFIGACALDAVMFQGTQFIWPLASFVASIAGNVAWEGVSAVAEVTADAATEGLTHLANGAVETATGNITAAAEVATNSLNSTIDSVTNAFAHNPPIDPFADPASGMAAADLTNNFVASDITSPADAPIGLGETAQNAVNDAIDYQMTSFAEKILPFVPNWFN